MNQKTGVFFMGQDGTPLKEKGGVYNSFFQNNSAQAVYSDTSYVEAGENIFKNNIPLVYASGLLNFPVPEIISATKNKDKVTIKYKPGNQQLKNLGNEIARVKVSPSTEYDSLHHYDISCKYTPDKNVECSFPASRLNEGISAPYNSVSIAATYETYGGGKHTTPFSQIVPVKEDNSPPPLNANQGDGCHIAAGTSFNEIKKLVEETAAVDMKCRVEYTDADGNKAAKKVLHFPAGTFHFSSTLTIQNNGLTVPIELRGPANSEQAGAPPTTVFVPDSGFPNNTPGLHLSGGVRLINLFFQNFPKAIISNGGDILLEYVWFKKNITGFEAQSNPDAPKNILLHDCVFEENLNSIVSYTLDLGLLGNYYKNNNGNLISMEASLIEKYPAPVIYNAVNFGEETHVNVSVNEKIPLKYIEIFKVHPNLQGVVEPIPHASMKCNPSSGGKFNECILKSSLLKMLSGNMAPALSASLTYTSAKKQEHSTPLSNFYSLKTAGAPEAKPDKNPNVPPPAPGGEETPEASIPKEEDPTKVTPPIVADSEKEGKKSSAVVEEEKPITTDKPQGPTAGGSTGNPSTNGNEIENTDSTEPKTINCTLQQNNSFSILPLLLWGFSLAIPLWIQKRKLSQTTGTSISRPSKN